MTKNKQEKSKKPDSFRRFIRVNGKLVSKTFLRKCDADRWYAEMKRDRQLNTSGFDELQRSTFEEYAYRWLETRKANGQPQSSYQQEEARLRLYILPLFGFREIDSIATREWEQFLNELAPKFKLGPATRNRVRALLSKLYNDARRERLVDGNPITIIPKTKERMKKWDYWSEKADCARYLENSIREGIAFYLFAHLALNTGARVGELIALEHQDIDLERGRIRIWRIFEAATRTVCERTKGFSERWLGINDSLLHALKRHRQETKFKEPDSPILCNSKGKRLDQHQIREMHLRVCRSASVKTIRVHDLRHTFASHYVMNSGSLAELQGLLGHTSSAMTLKYAHLAPGFLASRASVVSFSSQGEKTEMKLVVSK